MRRPVAVTLAGALLVLTAACGDDDATSTPDATNPDTTNPDADAVGALPAAVQHLELIGTEYAFAFAEGSATELSAGWTSLTFRNEGDEAHQVMFASLREGVDLAEMAEAAAGDSSGGSAIKFVDMLGGVSYIAAGDTIEAMVELPEGMVLAMCYVPDPNGVAHALSGMQTALDVGAAPGSAASEAADGEALQGTIELGPDGYEIPDVLPEGWYRVANTDEGTAGEGLHELSILRLGAEVPDGEVDGLLDELATNAETRVPVEAVGGMGALSPGFDGYLRLDLDDAPHLAVDFMPDPRQTRPHLLDGYYSIFTP